ncbi:MAG TPA: proline dehydrogenase family protein [Chloroflexota bacterium]|nr:proline dehydrogenase family protein [Chloroflexota bacterium]
MSLWRSVVLGLASQPPVQRFVVSHELARPLRERFVAGETLEQALTVAGALNRAGFRVTLDHLGEEVLEPAAADRATDDYLALVAAIRREGVASGISIKLSQLGLRLDPAACQARLERLLAAAQAAGVFVRIDMESSAYTQATLDLFRAVWPRFHNVGVVLQAYLYRTAQDLEDMLALGATVRLCKGAYREPPTVAYQSKAAVDANFARLARRLLEAGSYAALATHDPRLIAQARADAAALGRAPNSFEFQMLYGVRRDLQQALRDAGYRVRIYVPYGQEWYPYLTRRLAERPANLWFLARALWADSQHAAARAA